MVLFSVTVKDHFSTVHQTFIVSEKSMQPNSTIQHRYNRNRQELIELVGNLSLNSIVNYSIEIQQQRLQFKCENPLRTVKADRLEKQPFGVYSWHRHRSIIIIYTSMCTAGSDLYRHPSLWICTLGTTCRYD